LPTLFVNSPVLNESSIRNVGIFYKYRSTTRDFRPQLLFASEGIVATSHRMVTSPLSERPFLFVRGFRISSIQSLKPRATKEFIQREWFTLGGCDFQDGSMDEIIPEALWRTLVADPGPSGTATPL